MPEGEVAVACTRAISSPLRGTCWDTSPKYTDTPCPRPSGLLLQAHFPKAQGGALSWGLCCCPQLSALYSPKRSWLLVGGTWLASRCQFSCSHFSKCLWLLAREFSRNPLSNVLSESLHIHKILMESSQGLWGFTSVQESSVHTQCLPLRQSCP